MSITTITDPRSELIQWTADNLDHLVCDYCWLPGMPMLCGDPDDGCDACPEECGHPECPMCGEELLRHRCWEPR